MRLPISLLSVLSIGGASFSFVQSAKRFIQRGRVLKGVTTVSHANLEEVCVRIDAGEDLRHSNPYYNIFMIVGDRQQSLSSINVGVYDYALDIPVTAFWSKDPAYPEYLLTSFDNVWSQTIPIEERLQEL